VSNAFPIPEKALLSGTHFSLARPFENRSIKTQMNMGHWRGFGGLGVSVLASRVQTRPKPSDFLRAEKSSDAFLRKGSKGVGPMSQICGM
jgi:hypothetical protein